MKGGSGTSDGFEVVYTILSMDEEVTNGKKLIMLLSFAEVEEAIAFLLEELVPCMYAECLSHVVYA